MHILNFNDFWGVVSAPKPPLDKLDLQGISLPLWTALCMWHLIVASAICGENWMSLIYTQWQMGVTWRPIPFNAANVHGSIIYLLLLQSDKYDTLPSSARPYMLYQVTVFWIAMHSLHCVQKPAAHSTLTIVAEGQITHGNL